MEKTRKISEWVKEEDLKQKNLQHIEEMLQILSNEEILFVKGFLRKYYFD